ncbi:hypothetical protein IJZ97_00245 [bacterium]|nr:hypothetical protein [bacterium]
MNKKINLTLATLFIASTATFAASNFNYTQNSQVPLYQPNYYQQNNYSLNNNTLHGSVVSVPAGQTFKTVVTTPLSSQNLTLGQNVSVALGSDFYYNGNLIAPAGSSVTGTVLEVSKAKHGSLNGKLLVRFTQIVTPYGIQIPISAVIKTNDNTGVLLGGTKLDVTKEYTKDLAVGSAGGALSGVVFGALAGGDVGRGAALGTAVGAGGGLIKSIWDKGNDVEIPANASIDLVLTQPITVNPALNQSNY